jgi:hypothetical protein
MLIMSDGLYHGSIASVYDKQRLRIAQLSSLSDAPRPAPLPSAAHAGVPVVTLVRYESGEGEAF